MKSIFLLQYRFIAARWRDFLRLSDRMNIAVFLINNKKLKVIKENFNG